MGADISYELKEDKYEPVGDITVKICTFKSSYS